MPSMEFRAIPASEYPEYARYFQRACMRWQIRHDISLPTRAYLAERFTLASAKSLTDVYTGKFIPPAATILQIARDCGDSVEEHLMVANIDLAKRNRPPYDTFSSLMRYAEYHISTHPEMRHIAEVLSTTQTSAWMDHRSRWHDLAEEVLVSDWSPEQKCRMIAQMIDAIHSTGGHAPHGIRRAARA